MSEVFAPYERSYDYFASVAASLLAGDVQARVITNTEVFSIEVRLIDGTRVYWNNAGDYWVIGHLQTSGEVRSEVATLPWDIEVADAAKMIAMCDYPAPAEYPVEQPGTPDDPTEMTR